MFNDELDEDGLRKRIRTAGYCGIISLAFTIIIGFALGVFSGAAGIDPTFVYIDILVLSLLIYGTFRANRFAATGLFVFFVGSKLLQWHSTGSMSGIVVAALFGWFFYQGMIASWELPGVIRTLAARAQRSDQCPKCSQPITAAVGRCSKCGASLTQRFVAT
jgi:hypothetical protein